jgi:hypothetical protein
MELFRVGGDVPDTNYLFMGMQYVFMHTRDMRLIITQATLLTVVFTPSNPSSSCFASKSDTQIESHSFAATTSLDRSRLYMASTTNAYESTAA